MEVSEGLSEEVLVVGEILLFELGFKGESLLCEGLCSFEFAEGSFEADLE
jgi:hypothetical protein